jgi:chorismate synthase
MGVIIDGCPAGLPIVEEDIQREAGIRILIPGSIKRTGLRSDPVTLIIPPL